MLDADLAELYGVSTGRFNEQVRRNRDRFLGDFMFRLTNQEVEHLKSQIAISIGETREAGRGGRRYLPLAFTEHGAIMAATILNSPQATEVSVSDLLGPLFAAEQSQPRRGDVAEHWASLVHA
jgi:hypothetical protein